MRARRCSRTLVAAAALSLLAARPLLPQTPAVKIDA